jgi:hypothetical protein
MPQILLIDAFSEYDLSNEQSLREVLTEAKGIGTYKGTDDIRQAVLDIGFDLNRGQFKSARRRASSSANKQFDALFDRLKSGLINTTKRYLDGEIAKTRWQRWSKELLRQAYYDAFDLGLKSSGATKYRLGRADMDTRWIDSAWRQEMSFLTKFLKEIEGTTTPAHWGRDTTKEFPDGRPNPLYGKYRKLEPARLTDRTSSIIQRRLAAYAESVKHIYYAGRVMGTPEGMVIHWISPLDRQTCNGCRFLSDNSPYTKDTIPSTPRAGDTRCVNNCRCRLVMAEVRGANWHEVRKKQKSQRWYRGKLLRLKAGRAL